MLEQRRREDLVVDWHRDMKFRPGPMQETRVVSPLMVNVKSCSQKGSDHLFGFENGELRRHAAPRLRDRYRDPFRRQFRDVFRDFLAGADRALQVTPDRVSRHLAGFFQSLTAGADLGDGGNQNVVTALGEGFEHRCVAVFRHNLIVRAWFPPSPGFPQIRSWRGP